MIYVSRPCTIDVIQSFENDFQNKVRLNFNVVVKTLAIDVSLSNLMLSDLQYFQFKPNSYDYEGTKSFTDPTEVKNCRNGLETYTSKR